MDFAIQPRDLLRPTTLDLANEAKIIEGLTSPWAFAHVGLGPEEIYGSDPISGEVNPHTESGIIADLQGATAATSAKSLFNFNQGVIP